MLSSNLQSILDNRLRLLPQITRDAIASVDWPTILIEIGKKYGLHIDDMEEFQGVILKSMTGMIAPAQFESALITALALSPQTTETIITEVNEKIFQPIHDYVLRGGKPVDGMEKAGIVLDNLTPAHTVPPRSPVGESLPLRGGGSTLPALHPEALTAGEDELEPLASARFEDYFIEEPVVTDQSINNGTV